MAKIDEAVTKLINEACEEAAASLGKSLRNIGRINAGSNYPIAERNTVVHLAHALMAKRLSVVAEAKILNGPRNSRLAHIDLLAYGPLRGIPGKKVAIPIEVKAMGVHDTDRLIRDIERIWEYKPAASELVGKPAGTERHFWERSICFGLFVLQAHREEKYLEDWAARKGEAEEFFDRIQEVTGRRVASRSALAVRKNRWDGCKAVNLLWVAFRMPRLK
ncbi:MAG TPA: hypothetical protein PLC99_22555 [Verrucomicrobiota bacterium]|nr:hypothetical protein [Verrucomicrobiota bacterium]